VFDWLNRIRWFKDNYVTWNGSNHQRCFHTTASELGAQPVWDMVANRNICIPSGNWKPLYTTRSLTHWAIPAKYLD